jgi:hypothetical protein
MWQFICYALCVDYHCNKSLIMSVRNRSAVSTTLTRVERRMAQDEEFKSNVAKVKAVAKKSQSET